MAPRGSKRAVPAVMNSESPCKKSHVDPMFAGIVATLQGTEDLSEHCREMLIAMAPSLNKLQGERHSLQQLGVSMIEETLEDHKKKLTEAIEVAQKELSTLESSKSSLSQRLNEAKSVLAERKAAKAAAQSAHQDAKAGTKAADVALAKAQQLQAEADTTRTALAKELSVIEAAFEEHFKVPMDANEGPHHNFLKPFLGNLGLEESLTQALPSSCVKTKEQRGGFDDLVLAELGKAFIAKIAGIAKSLADQELSVSECNGSFMAAQTLLEQKNIAEQTAQEDLEAAKAEESDAEAQVGKASDEWAAFEPRVQEALENTKLHETKLKEFEEGPLKSFETLRDRDVPQQVEVEASVAGA